MNQNIILLSYLLIKNKLYKLFNFTNYYGKLLCILNPSDLYLIIKSRQFFEEYKLFINYGKILKGLDEKYTISELIKLSKISLNYKSNNIPTQIGLLVNLEELNYYNYYSCKNKAYIAIYHLPKEIFNLINLKKLDFGLNSISFIHTEIGNLINLKNLDFFSNPITFIPTEIGNLINLENLNMHSNKITTIPTQIGNLVNLKKFIVSNNALKYIPSEMGNLVSLNYFDITANPLVFIPVIFCDMVDLIVYIDKEQTKRLLNKLNFSMV
jgi:hypothetical protein